MATTKERFARFAPLPTQRRERWWYSDGAWIDQGQTGGVVGGVWTHWLADRGVEGEFGEAFSRELFHDAQREGGMEPDDNSGAMLADAVEVLQRRGLLKDCRRCTSVAGLTSALLERGPVVAGISWREPMFQPDRADGPPVVRFAAGAPVVGGHAILLDGIDLDLELGRTKGFIRFKNTWGRSWGENGLCLLALDDVPALLEEGADFLLATPTSGPEPPPEDDGPKLDAASEPETDSEPEIVRYEQEAIGSDRYTTEDSVGYGAYADAIVRGILHPETRPPLTIGIKAPWGAGKTSLMRMVQRRLEGSPRELRLAGGGAEVTNRVVLQRVSDRSGERRTLSLAGTHDDEWRATVWFNPWMYQTGEQVWAGFAHEIIGQVTCRLPRVDRERFWLELNRSRIDEQAVRRAIYALVFERVLPWLVFAVVLLLAGVALFVAGAAPAVAGAVTAGGPLTLAVATAWRGASVMRSGVGGALAGAVKPADAARGLAAEQLAGAVDKLSPDPGYESRSGFFQLMRNDVQHVIDLVATEQRPLVIFIDDLDRCSPGTVVQVIEAINLFLAGEFRSAIFVIAVEPEMVAAHIEAAYGDLVSKLQAHAEADALGWRFLEKFIQLPLTLPLMEPERAQSFVGSLFPGDEAVGPAVASAPQTPEAAVAVSAATTMLSQQSLTEAFKFAEAVGSEGPVGEALRRVVARKLSRDAPEMRDVIERAAVSLRANPREIKRFANVFRFLVMIATERRLAALEAPDELAVLAKLAVLSTRWPAVVVPLTLPLGDDPRRTVFDLLEDPPRSAAKTPARRAVAERGLLEKALANSGLGDAAIKRLLGDDLLRFLAAEPSVGAVARDWL